MTRDGVVHMAFHPRSDAIILAAGDKGGRVSLWQLDHESFEVLLLEGGPALRPYSWAAAEFGAHVLGCPTFCMLPVLANGSACFASGHR